jgi:hypothetical protein
MPPYVANGFVTPFRSPSDPYNARSATLLTRPRPRQGIAVASAMWEQWFWHFNEGRQRDVTTALRRFLNPSE